MNNFSITSRGIGEAFLRSASALAAAGNSIDEAIGLFVAANNVVQDPTVVGTAIRTISMRLMSTAGDLEQLGEDAEGAAESVTKLQTQLLNLTSGRVDIMQDADSFKNTTQILQELANTWKHLSQVQQAEITRLVAGVRQGNVFSALMTGMADGIAATETSLNSFGSAIAENEKWMQSIEGRTSQLKASFQGLSESLIDDTWIKIAISGLDLIVQGLNKFDDAIVKLIGVPLVFVGISSAIKSLSKLSFFQNAGSAFAGLLKPKYRLRFLGIVGTPIIGNANGCLRPVNYQPMSKSVSKIGNILGSIELKIA